MSGGPHYFELPASFAQPALFQDTFATGNGLGWTSLPGSQFSVVQSGNTRVFRQASTAGDAGAVLDAYDWTSQSIQAEVKPTAVNGNNRWVGLATRRTDASNYYYVSLRSSGIIQLKRNQGGVFATLDSASVPWALNRTYRLRLESVGTLHRVYVDGSSRARGLGRRVVAWARRAALVSRGGRLRQRDRQPVPHADYLRCELRGRREPAEAAARAVGPTRAPASGRGSTKAPQRSHVQADVDRAGCARRGGAGADRQHRPDRGGARAAARVQCGWRSVVRRHGQIQ